MVKFGLGSCSRFGLNLMDGGSCWLIEASCGLGYAEDDDAGWWLLGMAMW
jgi:hypothetical protein